VLKGSDSFDERIFRENLAQRLPKYMVPSHFMVIQELPRTLNGKIDKKSLASLFIDQKEQSPLEPIATPFKSDDPVYDDLRLMWIDLLGTSILRPSDNFFNIGGNSLLAVQLFSKIAKKYRLNLPLSLLLEATDFQNFVNAVKIKLNSTKDSSPLNRKLPNAYSSIVSIKASGQKNPVFCFHGVGGNVLNYMSLVPAFSANRPLVGLQSRGMDGIQPMTDSIEEMAKFYITEMKAVQPHGPYFLAGGSMGGTIAFEVAQQLTLQGETIEKLVMFDTFGPNINIKVYDKSDRSFWQNLKISFFYRRKTFTNKVKVKFLNLFNQRIPLEIRLFNLEMNNYQALWKYRPQIYSGDLHIIRAKMKSAGWYSDPLMGWSETIIGKIETYEIEGNHNDFIESPELCKVFAKLL
jgi:pimeloyl-ACP methyl ester carboxylesterase